MKTLQMNKRGMFENLSSLALGLMVFAVIVVVATVVVFQLGNSTGGQANTTATYLGQQLGSTNGGLASYTPIIITVGIAVVIIGAIALFAGRGKRY